MDVKVVASGIIALCLTLSTLLYISSTADSSLGGAADNFFVLALVLVFIVVLLSLLGIKVKFP